MRSPEASPLFLGEASAAFDDERDSPSGRATPASRVGLPAAQGMRLVDRALIAYARGPEHPAKIRLLRWLIRWIAGNRLGIRYAAGATVAIDPTDYIGWAILRTGQYEAATLDLALRLMAASPGLFVDVGANFGWFSCAIAPIVGSTVIAIEPDIVNGAALRANLADWPNTTVVAAAAGACFGAVGIARRSPNNAGTAAIVRPGQSDGEPDGWCVTAPLDALLPRIVVPPDRPVLMKIDVEGAERDVLAGLDFTGPFRPRNIIMEYTEYGEEAWGGLAAVQAFFDERGYELLDVFGNALMRSREIAEANIWARER